MKITVSEYSLILDLIILLSKSCESVCTSCGYSLDFKLLYSALVSDLCLFIHHFEDKNIDFV